MTSKPAWLRGCLQYLILIQVISLRNESSHKSDDLSQLLDTLSFSNCDKAEQTQSEGADLAVAFGVSHLLDGLAVCEEHGKTINAHPPSSSGRQAVLQSQTEPLINIHGLVIPLCLGLQCMSSCLSAVFTNGNNLTVPRLGPGTVGQR